VSNKNTLCRPGLEPGPIATDLNFCEGWSTSLA
jgi:hypothetical protein